MFSARTYIACLLATLSLGVLQARAHSTAGLDTTWALSQYVQNAWQVQDGLPQNTVRAMAQTPDGYLWLGTDEGLARFNGTTFTVYDRTTTPELPDTRISALYPSPTGGLWVGTLSGGLFHLDDGRWSAVPATSADTIRAALALNPAHDAVWLAAGPEGVFRLQDGRLAPHPQNDAFDGLTTQVIAEAPAGALWVGTHEGLFYASEQAVEAVAGIPEGEIVSAVHTSPDGAIWVGTTMDLYRVERGPTGYTATPQTLGVPDAPERLATRTLYHDSQGSLWIGTDKQGLWRYRPGHTDRLGHSQGLTHNRVLTLFEDREGSLWIGTEGGGVNRIRQGKVQTYGTREGLPMNMVLTVTEAPDGSLWAGLEGGGLIRVVNDTVHTYTVADGLASNIVSSVATTPDGSVWIGTFDQGLQRWHDGRFSKPYTHADGLPNTAVVALHTAPDGSLWMGTGGGVARLHNGQFQTYTVDDGLSSPYVTALAAGPSGEVWVANFEGTLDRIAPDGTITTYGADHNLPADPVLSFHIEKGGALWMSTYGSGLVHYDGERFRSLNTTQGIRSDIIYSIQPDAEGHLWMSSNKGLFTINTDDARAALADATHKVATTVYDEAAGLRSREFNGGVQPASWRAQDGTLWFASVEGLVGLHPERMPLNLTPPLVAIEQVDVDHTLVDPSATDTRLEPGRKRFAFTLAGLSFIAPEQTTFLYMLEGYDDTWETSSTAQITYTGLAPGAYTLRVQAINADGVVSNQSARFSFYHRAFFWQQPWFWLIGALALIGAAALIVLWRIRLLKARQAELEHLVDLRTAELREEKERVEEAKAIIEEQAERLVELDRFKTAFFANISHEFRTPLTLMIGPLQNALSGAFGEVSGPVQAQLSVMLRNAMRMLRLINQLLDLSKLESNRMEIKVRPRNLVAFTESVVYSFTAYAEQKGIALTLDADAERHQVYYEPDKIEKVLYNLLSNAMKFTPADGQIAVSLTEQPATADAPDGWVEIRVQDSGRGIPADVLPYVFDRFRQVDGSNTRDQEGTGIGLALVRELVLLHHGTIDVESTWGEGTTFVVRLRKGCTHFSADDVQDAATDELPEDAEAEGLLEQGSGHVDQLYRVHELNRPAQVAQAPEDAPLLLVVDDNADIRQYIADCLSGLYHIVEACDGAEGFTQAEQHHPDLIITDLMMPNVDGHAFTANIRADEDLAHTPIIILSAKTSQETVIRGLEHGADEYLAKPFNARELKIRIANLLKLRAQERDLKELNDQLEEKVEQQVQTILHQRERYEAELIAEKEKAEEASRVKSVILNNMSHEFRTPLAAIISSAEILEMEVEGELQEFAGYARTNGERLLKTLAAVLELADLEGSGSTWQGKNINVVPALQKVYQQYRAAASDKDLDLHVTLDQAHVLGYFDAHALERLVSVLVDNALKFTERGEVTLEAGYEHDTPYVRVRDTGRGISDAFRPKLFEAFHQESSGDTRAYEGTGLSLSIAKRLADRANARLTVDSTPGEGSTFTLYLATQAPVALSQAA